MCEEDVLSVLSYVRILAPIANQAPRSQLDFPVNPIARTLPQPAHNPQRCPEPADSVDYGRHLVNPASCTHCHTPHDGPDPIAGKAFAGGVEFRFPDGSAIYDDLRTQQPVRSAASKPVAQR